MYAAGRITFHYSKSNRLINHRYLPLNKNYYALRTAVSTAK